MLSVFLSVIVHAVCLFSVIAHVIWVFFMIVRVICLIFCDSTCDLSFCCVFREKRQIPCAIMEKRQIVCVIKTKRQIKCAITAKRQHVLSRGLTKKRQTTYAITTKYFVVPFFFKQFADFACAHISHHTYVSDLFFNKVAGLGL